MTTELDKQAMDLYLSGRAKTLKEAYAIAEGEDISTIEDLFRKAGIDL